ncbi:hypothetical protein KCP69_20695 [Salmonella enterica subsp. enterica]|nr:hypothetical protein KCP69_20695 [Salmonella enterica subsp. enterica]
MTIESPSPTGRRSINPCPVNLTNHVLFNLDGDRTDVRQHKHKFWRMVSAGR